MLLITRNNGFDGALRRRNFQPIQWRRRVGALLLMSGRLCLSLYVRFLSIGLRWFGGQFQLTLKQAHGTRELEHDNRNTIEKAIEKARKAPGAMKTLQGDDDLNFYSRAAQGISILRVGWRNQCHARSPAGER